MIKRFSTFEAASIYAGKMRQDGYYAEILDEGTGFLYGRITMGGFRVMVSELSAEEDEEPPVEVESGSSVFDQLLRTVFLAILAAAGLAALVVFMKTFERSTVTLTPDFPITVVGLIGVSILGVYIGKVTRRLFAVADDSGHRWKEIAKIIVALIALVMLLFI